MWDCRGERRSDRRARHRHSSSACRVPGRVAGGACRGSNVLARSWSDSASLDWSVRRANIDKFYWTNSHCVAMDVHVSLEGRGDLAARIYRQILDAVLDGRLRPGERLPPTRDLAVRLKVSRNTVSVAYERLVAEGYLDGRVGDGTFVCMEPLVGARGRHAPSGASVQPRPLWQSLQVPPEAPSVAPPYDFRAGTPDARLFPLTAWRRLIARELRPAAVRL